MSEEEILTTQDEEVIEQTETVEQPQDIKEVLAEELEKADQKARDERGRFAPKQQETVEAEPEKPAYQPKLNGYDNAAREKLSKLDPETLALIDQREEKFHKGLEGYRERARFADDIGRILQPDVQLLQQYNIAPQQFIENLINVERQLRSPDPMTKINAVHAILKDYGVDINALAQVPFDERGYRLQQENQLYKKQLEQAQASRQSAEVEQLAATIESQLPELEFFEELYPTILNLLQQGGGLVKGNTPEEKLRNAHAMALRMDDCVFGKYQAKQQEEAKRQDALKANQAAKAAKAAAVSVKSGSPVGRTTAQTPVNTVDIVRQAVEQYGL